MIDVITGRGAQPEAIAGPARRSPCPSGLAYPLKFLADKKLYTHTRYCLARLRALDRDRPDMPPVEVERYHFYWQGPFGAKQAFALKSLLATQQTGTFELWLWLDHESGYDGYLENPLLRPLLSAISVRRFIPADEAKGTPLEGRKEHWERPSVKRSNFFRHIVLFRYGGTYVDTDTAILRDMGDLRHVPGMAPEFINQWSYRRCGNSAMLRLRKESSTATALLERGLAKGNCDPRDNLRFEDTEDLDLLVLPAAFFDPLWLCYDGRDKSAQTPFGSFSEFFRPFDSEFPRPQGFRDHRDFFPGAFAYHWHNQWQAPEVRNSYYGILDAGFSAALNRKAATRFSSLRHWAASGGSKVRALLSSARARR